MMGGCGADGTWQVRVLMTGMRTPSWMAKFAFAVVYGDVCEDEIREESYDGRLIISISVYLRDIFLHSTLKNLNMYTQHPPASSS